MLLIKRPLYFFRRLGRLFELLSESGMLEKSEERLKTSNGYYLIFDQQLGIDQRLYLSQASSKRTGYKDLFI